MTTPGPRAPLSSMMRGASVGSCAKCVAPSPSSWEFSCCHPGGSWAGRCSNRLLTVAGRAQSSCHAAKARRDAECFAIVKGQTAQPNPQLMRACIEQGVRECGKRRQALDDDGEPKNAPKLWCQLASQMDQKRKFYMWYRMCVHTARLGESELPRMNTNARAYCEQKAALVCFRNSNQAGRDARPQRLKFPWRFWCAQSGVKEDMSFFSKRYDRNRFCLDHFGPAGTRACLGTRNVTACPFAESYHIKDVRERPAMPPQRVPVERTAIIYVAQNGQHSSYGRRHWQTLYETSKMNGTLQVTDQSSHLNRSLTSLFSYYNHRFHHPVLIFHTGDFDPQTQARLSVDRPSLRFVNLTGRYWTTPSFVDASTDAQAAWRGHEKYSLGYRLMIRWYGVIMWDWLEENGFEWVMRMDDDSYLHSHITYNLFDFMATNDYVYGFRQIVVDGTRSFAELIKDYLAARNLVPKTLFAFTTPPSPRGLKSRFGRLQREGQGGHAIDLHSQPGWTGLGFYNNFFISKVGFWRHRLVQDFLRYVDRSCMIFTERLNDLQIQSIAVQIFASARQQYWFDDFSYSHATTLTKSVPSKILYGGLSIGRDDPNPAGTAALYGAAHYGVITSWPDWPIFGTSKCFVGEISNVALTFTASSEPLQSLHHQWLAEKLCAEDGRLKRLYDMRGLYCDPSLLGSHAQSSQRILAFRGHPQGLAFTIPALKLAYLPIPKAMSTTLRALLVALQDSTPAPPSAPWIAAARRCISGARSNESAATRRVTCARGLRTLRDSDASKLTEQGHLVFTVVRDPVSRFISAFGQVTSYTEEREPWLHSLASRFPFWSDLSDPDASDARPQSRRALALQSHSSGRNDLEHARRVFAAFVADVVQDGAKWDAHVLPQVHFLGNMSPQSIRILRMEDVSTWSRLLIAAVTKGGATSSGIEAARSLLNPANAANSGSAHKLTSTAHKKGEDLFRSLPLSLLSRWCEVYMPDFRRFGYELPVFCRPGFAGAAAALPPVAGVSAIFETHDHRGNVAPLAASISSSPAITEAVIIDDGSVDGSGEEWEEALRSRPAAQLQRLPNVHEIRAYNAASRVRIATPKPEVLCFFQDDDIPEDANAMQEFITDTVEVFNAFRHQRLAVVSGRATSFCGREIGPQDVQHALNASRRRLPALRIPYTTAKGTPFMFVTEAWLAPMCVRRDAFEIAGGFNESLSRSGEPGIGLDIFISLQLQLKYNMTVGLIHSRFVQGVSGHASTATPEKTALRRFLRDRNARICSSYAGCSIGRWPSRLVSNAGKLNSQHLQPRTEFGSPKVLDGLSKWCKAAVDACA